MYSIGVTPRYRDGGERLQPAVDQPVPALSDSKTVKTKGRFLHAAMKRVTQYLHATLLILCFLLSATCLHVQQWVGTPLYWCNQKWSYSWQAFVKESTALLVLGLNQWRVPMTAQVSGDSSVRGQIRKTPSRNIIFDFPDRIVLIANHQLYTDWISLWWSAYTARFHGHFFVVLKESLRKIPILGPGMMFFSWIFLSRRWEADRSRLQQSMNSLSDPKSRSPMWLLIFPEGTNMSKNARGASKTWANRNGIPDLELTLLPRTRGLQFCLQKLADSVDWMYDCTIAYDGIPLGEFGQEIYNLKSLYLEGRKAPHTHIHWRRFAVKGIPLLNPQAFDQWLYERWVEKDKLLKHFQQYGHFPTHDGFVHANIELHSFREAVQIFASLFAVLVAWWISRLVYENLRWLLFVAPLERLSS